MSMQWLLRTVRKGYRQLPLYMAIASFQCRSTLQSNRRDSAHYSHMATEYLGSKNWVEVLELDISFYSKSNFSQDIEILCMSMAHGWLDSSGSKQMIIELISVHLIKLLLLQSLIDSSDMLAPTSQSLFSLISRYDHFGSSKTLIDQPTQAQRRSPSHSETPPSPSSPSHTQTQSQSPLDTPPPPQPSCSWYLLHHAHAPIRDTAGHSQAPAP